MASPARFTFDLNLEQAPLRAVNKAPPPPPPPPGIPEDVVAQLVAAARDEAYAEGKIAGAKSAEAMAAQAIAAAAATLATQTAKAASVLDDALTAQREEAVGLALSIGRKLALHLVARFPLVELQALITECLASLNGVPHLVIRCSPELAEAVREAATAQMTTSGFSGRLVVMGDPEIRLGDGRLEWVDGGLVRDIAALSSQIDQHIALYLTARSRNARTQENGT